jgi:DNA polymerase-4
LVQRFRVADGGWPDDAGCPILHVDMDAFYASVELRTRPELKDKPVMVAGGSVRGVVLAANYPARKFGVHSAMPVMRARKLCPQGVFLPPMFHKYVEVSRGVMAAFRELTPLVEPLSLDEAFLDVSGALRRLKLGPAQIGAELRRRVQAEHDVTCSVGVAPTKFVAKLASGLAKPDGMVVVPKGQVLDFLHPLPVSALWGVGQRTAERLLAVGLARVGDVAAVPLPRLRRTLGVAVADTLYALAHGHDDRPVVPETAEKSIGSEETFEVDQADRDVVKRELLRLSEKTATAMRKRGLRGRTVSIKVRYGDFSTITRSRTLPVATDVTQLIFRTAVALLDEQTPPGAIRLIGVRVEQLGDDSGEQLTLDAPDRGWREADQAADVARGRFGHGAVRPASLLGDRPHWSGILDPPPDRPEPAARAVLDKPGNPPG